MKTGLQHRLMAAAADHPWRFVAAWLAAMLVGVVLIAQHAGTAFSTQVQRYDGSDSSRAEDLLRQRFADRPESGQPNEILVLHSTTRTVDDPLFQAQAQALADRLMAVDAQPITWALSYFMGGDSTLVSGDRHSTMVPMLVRDPERTITAIQQALGDQHDAASDISWYLVGRASVGTAFKTLAQHDLQAELKIGLPMALLVLLVVFATVVAALVPLLIAAAAIVVALAVTVVAGPWIQAYFLVTNMIVMMGLAVGIDYSLFLLSRYRQECADARPPREALMRASASAGKAIAYSGATVVLALLGLLIIPTNVYRSLAAGAILVVLLCLLAAFTLLPALVILLGDRLDRLRILLPLRGSQAGWWDRFTGLAIGFPTTCLLLTTGLLLALALPALDMKTGFSGIDTLPADTPARRGFDLLEREFRIGTISQAVVVVDGAVNTPAVTQALARLRTALASDTAFFADKATQQVNPAGDLAVLTVPMSGDAESPGAQAGVIRMREQHIRGAFDGTDAHAVVTGNAAGYIDFFRLTDLYTPRVFGIVLSLSFILLALAFRSLVVPLKAIVLNLLSVGAAYGLMVLVFQRGIGASVFGFQQVALIEAWIPLFLFTILYGLSMDYHVFLLSRIREHFIATGDNTQAIRVGVRSTSGVITGAALIMVAIFAGFASGELVMFQQVGFGLGVAVLLDATIVRSFLVPAAMTLLGVHNWYMPRWLQSPPRSDLPPRLQPLLQADRYPGTVAQVEVVETHISWILLAGDRAYKIKKPVQLPFLDFSTLALRKRYCDDELRLNQRFAPDLYLEVLELRDTGENGLQWGGSVGPIVEFAVHMRRFDEAGRLDRVCQRGALTPSHVSDLADTLVAFHDTAAIAPAGGRFGSAQQVLAPALDNFNDLAQLSMDGDTQQRLAALRVWTETQHQALAGLMQQRLADGRVRECHGDLHLANMVLIDGRVRLFDCLEFNEELRWIDVANEIAFTYIDLRAHGQSGSANWFVDEVFSRNGDYSAACVLPFYAVYRAMVRAKVDAVRAGQSNDGFDATLQWITQAEQLVAPQRRRLIITHGLAGCGKTVASNRLLQQDSGARTLRLRSDVERRRLFGLERTQRSGSAINSGIYDADAHQRVYTHLQDTARMLLAAGWSVVIDAAFLQRSERDAFRALAAECDADFAILAPHADVDELRRRITTRQALGTDASEATLDVLDKQLQWIEPLDAGERVHLLDV
ncbi:MAG: MMPL family transporter [Burkholderiaceae bacterium]